MSFQAQALMAHDENLLRRAVACATIEGVHENGTAWVTNRAWKIATREGWGAKYERALQAGHPAPGADAAVISDAEITAAIRDLIAADSGGES